MKPQIFGIIVISTLLLGCAQSQEELVIGGLFSLTGGAADWGQEELNAAKLAFGEANAEGGIGGAQLTLAAQDIKTADTTAAITAYRFLRDIHGAKFMIGPTWSEPVQGVADLAAQDAVLLISPSSGAKRDLDLLGNEHFISLWPSDRFETEFEAARMSEANIEEIAIIYNKEIYAEYMKDHLAESAQAAGIEVLRTFAKDPEEKDYRSVLVGIPEDADAVYLVLSDPGTILESVLRQRHELGIALPFYLNLISENPELLDRLGPAFDDVYFPAPAPTQEGIAFKERYLEAYGSEPTTPSAALAYDSANLLIDALRSGASSPEEVASWILAVENYPGAALAITFDAHGDLAARDFVLKTARNGEYVTVWPE